MQLGVGRWCRRGWDVVEVEVEVEVEIEVKDGQERAAAHELRRERAGSKRSSKQATKQTSSKASSKVESTRDHSERMAGCKRLNVVPFPSVGASKVPTLLSHLCASWAGLN